MSDLLKILLIPLGTIILILVLIQVVKVIIRNLKFKPEDVSLKNRWVHDCFFDEAHYLVQRK